MPDPHPPGTRFPDGAAGGPAEGDDAVDGGEEGDGEVDLEINSRPEVLDELQVSQEEFEWAVGRALDRLEDMPEDEEACAVEDVEVVLNGRTFRLEEVAEIEIGGDLSELGPLPEVDEHGELIEPD